MKRTALFYILNRHAFVRSCQWQELLCIRKVWLGADSADNEAILKFLIMNFSQMEALKVRQVFSPQPASPETESLQAYTLPENADIHAHNLRL